jgi:hypothetical protein
MIPLALKDQYDMAVSKKYSEICFGVGIKEIDHALEVEMHQWG